MSDNLFARGCGAGHIIVECQYKHCTHSYDGMLKDVGSPQLPHCAIVGTNSSERGSCLTWRPPWGSVKHVSLMLISLNVLQYVPSTWLNRPIDLAVTCSTSAIMTDLLATRLLTHQVCSRGQIGGKLWGGSLVEVCRVDGCWWTVYEDTDMSLYCCVTYVQVQTILHQCWLKVDL